MKKRILATLLATCMIAAMVVGCGEKAATNEGEGGKELKFEIMVKSFQSSYWQAAVKGVEKAAKELGVKVHCDGPAAESDIADQVKMIDNAIEQKPDGIGLAACDATAVLPSMQKALEAKIPVVCFDAGVPKAPEGSVYATIVTNNGAAAAIAADKLFEAVKDKIAAATADAKVRIGEVNQDAVAANIQERGLGFINRMIELCTEAGKKVAVVGNEFFVGACSDKGDEATAEVIIEVAVPTETSVAASAPLAQNIMAKKDTIAIFGSNQVTAEGVISANDNLNVLSADPAKGIVAAGFDAGTPQKTAITNGVLLGAVTQSPLMMGYKTVYTLKDICDGKEVADIPMDGYWYDTTNMEAEDIAPNLYD